jgi:hypothetical protein
MVETNKDKLITLAVQGGVVPAQVSRQYSTTWDGRAKLCIGVGGINYNLKIGERVFGWANGDRAEPGVATDGVGNDRVKDSYRQKTGIGNEAKIISGEAKGDKGLVVGKHGYRLPGGGHHTLLHFEEGTLDKLAIGDRIRVKAEAVGLKIKGFKEVMINSASPKLIEGMGMEEDGDKLVVPVVMEVPHFLIGAGFGTRAHSSHIDIQTCYPPDVVEYGLDRLRFGDLVALQDILSDYGRQFYGGATTIGVVCSGPSEISGQGIGVTTIISSRTGLISTRIDGDANISKALGMGGD